MTENSSFGAVGQEPVMGTGRAAVLDATPRREDHDTGAHDG